VAEAVRGFAPVDGGAAFAEVARTGRARLFGTPSMDQLRGTLGRGRWMHRLAPRSAVVVPLAARGHTLGVITLVRTRTPEPYDALDLRLAEVAGYKAGLQIDNARLYRASRDAITERDRVLGVVAHDLRGPLTSILARTQIIEHTLVPRSPAGEPLRLALSRIRDSAMKMEQLIRDLLDVTRMQAGRMQAEMRSCAPGALVGDAVDEMRPQASAKSVAFVVGVDPGLPRVSADRDRVMQVFSNLLGNALKFTPAGGEIEVRAWMEGPLVAFAVRDTGPGIPAEHIAHVFDRFWQLKRADRRGAGLGLGICKWIVESHGGQIAVTSTPGKGSTFRFTLPVAA